MICYILYTVYNSYMNEQEIFPSPFDAISKMTGLGDDTEVIKHHIAPEDDTDSETENDITQSSLDNLDSVLEQLPSQIKKNIDCSIEKNVVGSLNKNNEIVEQDESEHDDSGQNESGQNESEHDESGQNDSEQDDSVQNESDQDDFDQDPDNSDQDDCESNVECNKLNRNNKLRMRKIDLIKKKKINEHM
jgi:hypothetical protein